MQEKDYEKDYEKDSEKNLNIDELNKSIDMVNKNVNNLIVNNDEEEEIEEEMNLNPKGPKLNPNEFEKNCKDIKNGLAALGFKDYDKIIKNKMEFETKYGVTDTLSFLRTADHLREIDKKEKSQMEAMKLAGNPVNPAIDNPTDQISANLDIQERKLLQTNAIDEKKMNDFAVIFNRVYKEHQAQEPSEDLNYQEEAKSLELAERLLLAKGITKGYINNFKNCDLSNGVSKEIFHSTVQCSVKYFNDRQKSDVIKNNPAPSNEQEAKNISKQLVTSRKLTVNEITAIGNKLNSMAMHMGALSPNERDKSMAKLLHDQLITDLKAKGLTGDQIDKVELEAAKENPDFGQFMEGINHEVDLMSHVNEGGKKTSAYFYDSIGKLFKANEFPKGSEIDKDNILPSMKLLREMKAISRKFSIANNRDHTAVQQDYVKIEKFLQIKGFTPEQIDEVYRAKDDKELNELAKKDLAAIEEKRPKQEKAPEEAKANSNTSNIHLVIKDGDKEKEIDLDTSKRLKIVIDLNEKKTTIEDVELFDEVKPLAKQLGLEDNKDNIVKDEEKIEKNEDVKEEDEETVDIRPLTE